MKHLILFALTVGCTLSTHLLESYTIKETSTLEQLCVQKKASQSDSPTKQKPLFLQQLAANLHEAGHNAQLADDNCSLRVFKKEISQAGGYFLSELYLWMEDQQSQKISVKHIIQHNSTKLYDKDYAYQGPFKEPTAFNLHIPRNGSNGEVLQSLILFLSKAKKLIPQKQSPFQGDKTTIPYEDFLQDLYYNCTVRHYQPKWLSDGTGFVLRLVTNQDRGYEDAHLGIRITEESAQNSTHTTPALHLYHICKYTPLDGSPATILKRTLFTYKDILRLWPTLNYEMPEGREAEQETLFNSMRAFLLRNKEQLTNQ